MSEDEQFLADFEECRLTHEQWRHKQHIKVAYLYLRRYPFETAMNRIRERIQALNAVHQVPDLPDSGYHETVTQAWLRLVQLTLCEFGPAESSDEFYEQHPELSQHKNLRLFYSHDLIMSPKAKQEFVEPDLTPLPRSSKTSLPPA